MAHEITDEFVASLHASSDSARAVARNAVAHAGVEPVAFDRAKVVATPTVVSHKVDDWKVTSQKKSGRCWLFSSLNLLRSTARTRLGLKDFEFSQNYVLFWDKFERANFFLTDVIATAKTEDSTAASCSSCSATSSPTAASGTWRFPSTSSTASSPRSRCPRPSPPATPPP